MLKNRLASLAFAAAATLMLAAAPADAQGRGKGAKKAETKQGQTSRDGSDRPELRRRDADDRQDLGWWERQNSRTEQQGPPFCRNGQGHPVHGRRWCEDKGWGMNSGVWGSNRGVYESRDRNRDSRNAGRNGSYDEAHAEFHRQHDRQCRLRAAERPLDPSWQLRVRTECRQRHEDWHHRAGRSHG